jgi:hypothetical protein
MSEGIETIKSSRGNGLSDQPEEVRQQTLGQLQGASTISGRGISTDGPKLDRWLRDPLVGPAIARLVDALVSASKAVPVVPPTATSRGDMKREYQMGPGHVEYFPTWSFWGTTFVRMVNIGTEPTVILINEERFHLNPGEGHTKDGKWAAFPIRVVNTSELPGSLVSVTVT